MRNKWGGGRCKRYIFIGGIRVNGRGEGGLSNRREGLRGAGWRVKGWGVGLIKMGILIIIV